MVDPFVKTVECVFLTRGIGLDPQPQLAENDAEGGTKSGGQFSSDEQLGVV